jgi:hypothetical protein
LLVLINYGKRWWAIARKEHMMKINKWDNDKEPPLPVSLMCFVFVEHAS